jgi:steroid 5-alpha reductase family enzyme
LLWLFSLKIKDSSIVDIFWGFGFVVMAWFYLYLSENYTDRTYILSCMTTVWGLRLTFHIGSRNIGQPEDYRYQNFRKEGGESYWWISFFRVFLLQGLILWILSSIFFVSHRSDLQELTLFDYIGVVFWAIGIFFEAVGDYQLRQFRKNPQNKGKVLDTGLWKYTRHPNYFGDSMVWWGFYLFAFSTQGGWMYFFVPAFMAFLLRFVSGVAMLEEQLIHTKKEYKTYMRRTSAFLPLPPKKK